MKESILQIAKIVGKANSSSWAQVHSFSPQDEGKERKFGNLVGAISLTAKEEAVDIGSFGTEIISRLQETYYSSQAKTVLEKLKATIRKLTDEFSDKVDLAITLVVILPTEKNLVLYVALNKGRVVILRNGQLGAILKNKGGGEEKLISGFLKKDDFVVLATEQFFELISQGVLKASMEGKTPQETVESLAPIIHGRETPPTGRQANSQTAAVFIKVKSAFAESSADQSGRTTAGKLEDKETLAKKKEVLASISKKVSDCFGKVSEKLSQIVKKGRPSIYIRKESTPFLRRKKTNFTIAIVMIGLLLISVFFGLKEKDKRKISNQGDWLSQIEYQLDQVELLKDTNPLKAKSILKEIEEVLKEKEEVGEKKKKSKEIESFKKKMEQLKEELRHQYKMENPEVFLDLNLVKEGFKGNYLALTEDKIVVFDQNTGTVIDLDLKSKASKIVIGKEELKEADFLASSGERVFVLKEAKIFVIDKKKEEVIQEREIDDLGKASDLVGFASNCYLLDETKNRVLKFVGFEKGLSSPTDYLKGEGHDLSESISLAIDGSVWVLFTDGKVNKYVRGQKDAFLIMGLDEPFNQPIALYTDENCDNLYILDRNNTQVVVISKDSGDYQGAYLWQGLAGAIDFVVSEQENKMLFLTGQRIYEIGLRE